jgi:hypothetical protein
MKKYFLLILILFYLLSPLSGKERLSPMKAFLYSLIVPGTGQYYTHHKMRGGIYLVTEVLFLSATYYYLKSSGDAVSDYKDYADTHFYYSKTDSERLSYQQLWPLLRERVYAKVNLPYNKEGEYYELIGKLPELTFLWDESWRQKHYYDMRQYANRLYKWQTVFTGFLIVNHVVSAVDAYLSASSANMRLETGLNFENGTIYVGVKKRF